MNNDVSFIKLYKSLSEAVASENPPVCEILYTGFIQQLPNETFLQISSSDESISFVDEFVSDLVDGCNNLIANIDYNFYAEFRVDSNGITQIAFEFGMIGTDYGSTPLHLRLTDSTNGNVWYSSPFLITNNNKKISTRFDYWSESKFNNVSYDLFERKPSIRLSNCYDNTAVNKRDLKQYLQSNGMQVSYRSVTTYLRQFILNAIDYFVNDRLEVLFSHPIVYVNRERADVSDFKVDERKGDTNWFSGEFVINPKRQYLTPEYQIYDGLEIVDYFPLQNSTLSLVEQLRIVFNKPITLGTGTLQVFKDGFLIDTFTQSDVVVSGDNLVARVIQEYTDTGLYSIVVSSGLFLNGIETVSVENPNWLFTIATGEFDADDFDSIEFLT
jgi:hypothetical protein